MSWERQITPERRGLTYWAILYARVSTRAQTEMYSLGQQVEALRRWAEAEGYEVLEVVEDAGYSGTSLERPGLDHVRDLVEAGGVSVVVAQDRDRLAREPAYLYLLKEEFERRGTKLWALNDKGDDSPEGQFTDGILDQLAKFERAKTAERTRRGLDKKVREGRIIRGNQSPYGFRYGEDGEVLLVFEPEMAVMRRIFRMVGAEGASLGEVQRTLKREGVPSAMGGGWPRSTVRYLILNELYRPITADEVAACGLVTRDVASALPSAGPFSLWTWNKMRVKRSPARAEDGTYRNRVRNEARPREQWSAVPVDISEAGLSRELVDAARERLSQNERRPPSTRVRRLWLLNGGIARCALCGNAYSPHTVHDRGNIRPYYRCYTRFNHGLDACTNGRSTQAAPLEDAVWKAVRSLCLDPDRILSQYDTHVERLRQRSGDPDAEVRTLVERLKKLNKRRSAYHDLAADGDMSREELRSKLAEVDEKREEVRKVLREARNRQEMVHNLGRDRKLLHDQFASLRFADLFTLDPERRRRLMQALRLRVDVDEQSNVRISGVFDADITEMLPSMNRIPFAERDTRHLHYMNPPPFKGVVTVDSAPPCTS
jgi:site-specific DNA recombinase